MLLQDYQMLATELEVQNFQMCLGGKRQQGHRDIHTPRLKKGN